MEHAYAPMIRKWTNTYKRIKFTEQLKRCQVLRKKYLFICNTKTYTAEHAEIKITYRIATNKSSLTPWIQYVLIFSTHSAYQINQSRNTVRNFLVGAGQHYTSGNEKNLQRIHRNRFYLRHSGYVRELFGCIHTHFLAGLQSLNWSRLLPGFK